MKDIHKIYKIKRGIIKVPLIPKKESLKEIIFEVLKRQLHPPQRPSSFFHAKFSTKLHVGKHSILLLSLPAIEGLSSKKVIPHRVGHKTQPKKDPSS